MLNRQKFLNQLELEALKLNLDRSPSLRDSLMIRLALQTGARASELLQIQAKDLIEDTVLIRGLKGSNDREIPLPKQTLDLIRAFITWSNLNPSDRIFQIGYPRLVQIWEKWRPCKKSFHSLRHTRALEVFEKTGNVMIVKLALGHKSLNSSQVYLDFFNTQTELRKIL